MSPIAFLFNSSRRKPIALALSASLLCQWVQPGVLQARKRPGEIQMVEINDTDKLTTVHIRGMDLPDYQSLVLKDPKGKLPPQLYLTFNGATVSSNVQSIQSGTGAVVSVAVNMVAKDPIAVSQVVINLAAEATPRIKNNDGIWVEIDKKSPGARPNNPALSAAAGRITPVRQDQPLQSGDSLSFSVSPAEELSRDVVVDENGKISVPLVGVIDVSGLTADQLAKRITVALSHYVTNPKVDVLIKQYTGKQLSISGEVGRPGIYPYRSNMRLLDVLTMAGGILPSGNKHQVRILRGNGPERRVILINVEDVLASGDVKKDFLLEPGDLIEVAKGSNGITIFGEVERAGTFEYIYDMRILDLISLCGGFKDGASQNKIKLIRGEAPNTKISTIYFSQVLKNKKDANVRLMPGDILYVPTLPLWGLSSYVAVITPIATLILAGSTIWLAAKK